MQISKILRIGLKSAETGGKSMSNPNLPISGKYNTYIGARYVPLMGGEWNQDKAYEPLVIVTYQGNSYTSNTFVPAGMDINDKTYWTLTGNYNAQIDKYREEVESALDTINDTANDVHEAYTEILAIQPEIIKTANEAKSAITNTADNAINQINSKVTAATSEIDNKVSTVETSLDNKLITGKSEINSLISSGVNSINNASSTATSDISDLKQSIESELNSLKDEINDELTTSKTSAVEDIENTKNTAINEINDIIPNTLLKRDLSACTIEVLFACDNNASMGGTNDGNGGFANINIHKSINSLKSVTEPQCIHIVYGYSSHNVLNDILEYLRAHTDALITYSVWCESQIGSNNPFVNFNAAIEDARQFAAYARHIWTLTHAQMFQRNIYYTTNGWLICVYSTLTLGMCSVYQMYVNVANNDLKINRINFAADEECIRASLISTSTFPISFTDTVAIMGANYTNIIEFNYPFNGIIFPEFPSIFVESTVGDGNNIIYTIGSLSLTLYKSSTVTSKLRLAYNVGTNGLAGNTAANSFNVSIHSRHGFFETSYKRILTTQSIGSR